MPYAIRAGVGIREFWDLTYGELSVILDVYKQQREEESQTKMYEIYTTSALVARFVNASMQGKKLPDIYEIFPSLPRRTQEFDWNTYKQQFAQFAEGYNQQRGSNR